MYFPFCTKRTSAHKAFKYLKQGDFDMAKTKNPKKWVRDYQRRKEHIQGKRNSLQDALSCTFSIYSTEEIDKQIRPKLHKKLDRLVDSIITFMTEPSSNDSLVAGEFDLVKMIQEEKDKHHDYR